MLATNQFASKKLKKLKRLVEYDIDFIDEIVSHSSIGRNPLLCAPNYYSLRKGVNIKQLFLSERVVYLEQIVGEGNIYDEFKNYIDSITNTSKPIYLADCFKNSGKYVAPMDNDHIVIETEGGYWYDALIKHVESKFKTWRETNTISDTFLVIIDPSKSFMRVMNNTPYHEFNDILSLFSVNIILTD